MTDCVISNNVSGGGVGGAGVFVSAYVSAAVLTRCVFSGNYVDHGHGGGARLSSTSMNPTTLTDCVFLDNSADEEGGGLCVSGPSAVLAGCVFCGNSTSDEGGGLFCTDSISLVNCTFYGNSALSGGAAIGVWGGGTLTIDNTLIAFNGTGTTVYGTSCNAVLSCCDVYGNTGGDYVACIAGQNGVRGNFSLDPQFCDAAGGNLSLETDSPCLVDSCGQVGAYGGGCVGELPMFLTLADVPGDQGREMRLRWERSKWDAPGDTVDVAGYEVYRRQDEGAGLRLDGWDYLATAPAHGDSIYQMVVPTLCDSSASGICWSAFFVRATTPDVFTYFDSPPDSGYSVDNLAPSPPENLHWAGATDLAWDEAPEEDFDFFTVYGSVVAVLDETAVVIGYTAGTSMGATGYPYYHVTVTDFCGNEGEASTITDQSVGAPGVRPRPQAVTLAPTHPNPFRHSTTITFGLPDRADVRLHVYDVGGRRVRTLVAGSRPPGYHTVFWEGRDDAGRAVVPGLYFLRLEVRDFTANRKVVLLK
jgi:predicted outer membrane repeat protein